MAFFWQNPVASLHGTCLPCELQANAQFFVYEMHRGRLSHELGPYDLDTARQYGRIAATRGSHDRVVTRGRDGPIVKRYAAGSGAPLMANQGFKPRYRVTVSFPGGAKEGPFPAGYSGETVPELAFKMSEDLPVGSIVRISEKGRRRPLAEYRVLSRGEVQSVQVR